MAEIIVEHPPRKDPDEPVVEPQAKAKAKEEPKAAAVEEKKPEPAKAKAEDDKPSGAMRFGQGRR